MRIGDEMTDRAALIAVEFFATLARIKNFFAYLFTNANDRIMRQEALVLRALREKGSK